MDPEGAEEEAAGAGPTSLPGRLDEVVFEPGSGGGTPTPAPASVSQGALWDGPGWPRSHCWGEPCRPHWWACGRREAASSGVAPPASPKEEGWSSFPPGVWPGAGLVSTLPSACGLCPLRTCWKDAFGSRRERGGSPCCDWGAQRAWRVRDHRTAPYLAPVWPHEKPGLPGPGWPGGPVHLLWLTRPRLGASSGSASVNGAHDSPSVLGRLRVPGAAAATCGRGPGAAVSVQLWLWCHVSLRLSFLHPRAGPGPRPVSV